MYDYREALNSVVRPNQQREPRIMFNWGYHDAAKDAKEGRQRTLVEIGPQTLGTVSAERDVEYHAGYGFGLRYHAEGRYDPECNSEAAWREYAPAALHLNLSE